MAHTALKEWCEHREQLISQLASNTERNDFLFFKTNASGSIDLSEATSSGDVIEVLLKTINTARTETLIDFNPRVETITLHCFRRGGCQHRFFDTARCWSLIAVKMWGGWSKNESTGGNLN